MCRKTDESQNTRGVDSRTCCSVKGTHAGASDPTQVHGVDEPLVIHDMALTARSPVLVPTPVTATSCWRTSRGRTSPWALPATENA